MRHQACLSRFQTKRLAIGYNEAPNRKPRHKDAPCGSTQGFFLTQDSSPLAAEYPSEHHWKPRFKPPMPSVGNQEACKKYNNISDNKKDRFKNDEEFEIDRTVRFTERKRDIGEFGIQLNSSEGLKASAAPFREEKNACTDNSREIDITSIQKKPLWLSNGKQNTYIADKDRNSYTPSFSGDKKRNNVQTRQQTAYPSKRLEKDFQNTTKNHVPSVASIGPRQEEDQSYGVKCSYCDGNLL